jgi:hypothetical protein
MCNTDYMTNLLLCLKTSKGRFNYDSQRKIESKTSSMHVVDNCCLLLQSQHTDIPMQIVIYSNEYKLELYCLRVEIMLNTF